MNAVADALALLLIVVLGATAVLDILGNARVVATMARLEIPAGSLPLLGGLKILGAIGLLVGAGSVRLAEVTGVCLAGYFAVALLTHVRVRDGLRNSLPAFVLLAVCVAYTLATFAQ